jgi:glycosyltransferase involved in cell wall biosynthesis/acetyltransferase-like isoleucine patch superfamily enzyme
MNFSARRVLILVENLSVPFDQRVWREATALRRSGYKVSVICPMGKKFDRAFHERIKDVAIYRYPAYEAQQGILQYALEYGQALLSMFFLSVLVWIREGFDVIQLCNPPDLLYIVSWPYRLFGKAVIFDVHDLSPETYLSKTGEGGGARMLSILHYLESATFRNVDVVICTNESYRKVALERGGVLPERVFVVRNGPDLKRIAPVKPKASWRRGMKHMVLYVGTMGTQDGVDYLLRSVRHLVRELGHTDMQVVIVGGGPELEPLKKYSDGLGIAAWVTFTGRIPDKDMVEALYTADVCVCPDPHTPLNDISTMNKTLEYMAAGKAMVAYNLLETRVSAGESALYAQNNDEKDFAEKIAKLLDDPALRENLGKTGMERIHAGLSWDHSIPHLCDAYACALKAKGFSAPSENPLQGIASDVTLGSDVVIRDFVNLYGCSIGDNTKIGAFVEIQKGVTVGKNCKISSHSFLCEGVSLEDGVFIGHGVIFTNDRHPRATSEAGELQTEADWECIPTVVRAGASIGSGTTLLCGLEIGEGAMVGAGSVVTADVPAQVTVAGNPARQIESH